MDPMLAPHFEALKSGILTLKATGPDGFEGLVAVVLSEISGVPFRLASSGLQFGVDGKPSYDADAIYFEAKLYGGRIERGALITKIADLSRTEWFADLVWVLGATTSIGAQLAEDLRKDGRRNGISVLILDWTEIDLPPLAVALAMGGARVDAFFKDRIADAATQAEIKSALTTIRACGDFDNHAHRIRAELDAPALATALAQSANTGWLAAAFSDRSRARTVFSQPLAPDDARTSTVLDRVPVAVHLRPFFENRPEPVIGVVLGGEGCGKSWVAAQTWLISKPRPLMVVLGAEEFSENSWRRDLHERLIAKLIEQTGDRPTEANRERWRRRLDQWRRWPMPDRPRLVVMVDGINQKPQIDWGRALDRLSADLHAIGGSLIVTARTPYFRERVGGRLTTRPAEVIVPEWTPTERDQILLAKGVDIGAMHPEVSASLQNPRLLGIALEILGQHDLAALGELSVSRLLFEHMRASEQDAPLPRPANEFARQLQDHARIVLERVQQKQTDDLRVFEAETEVVADGRFFCELPGESGRYEIHEDGLTLALGFSLVDLLRVTKRNRRALDEALATVLEPVAALDDVAAVLLAALNVISVDDRAYDLELAAALVCAFAGLQNPDEAKFPTFAGLARSRPPGFLDAAARLCATGAYQPNFDWVHAALHDARNDDRAWSMIAEAVRAWLSTCSLAPELKMIKHAAHDSADQVEEERLKRLKDIGDRITALSPCERRIYNRLSQTNGDPSALWRLGLFLLAGKPLASFSNALINWSFINALNSHYNAPYSDYINLLSLNIIDWRATREALGNDCNPLWNDDVSRTGKWALAGLLRGTGASEDAEKAVSLVEELTKDRENIKGWRRVEDYCANDPCDPNSEKPNNVLETALRYAIIDVSKLRLHMGPRQEDHFFEMARPGVTRFVPDVAVRKHREFAQDVLARSGVPLRQGLFELRTHHALLSRKHADILVTKWRERTTTKSLAGLAEGESWFVGLYHLLLAFPFLNFEEQLHLLVEASDEGYLTLEVLAMIGCPNQVVFDQMFDAAWVKNDLDRLFILLVVAKEVCIPLSASVHRAVVSLVISPNDRLRTQALGLAAQTGDPELLAVLTDSSWHAAKAVAENGYEAWYGSVALLKAAAQSLLSEADALQRISPRLYGRAAAEFGPIGAQSVARKVDASIRRAVSLGGPSAVPEIEKELRPDQPDEPSLTSIQERKARSKDFFESMHEFNESSEKFEERQRNSYTAYSEFEKKLTRFDARIVLDELSMEAFASFVRDDAAMVEQWFELFLSVPATSLPTVHNLVLLLAHAFAAKEPEKSMKLFRKVRENQPLVRFVYRGGIDLDATVAWAGSRNDVLDRQRRFRLDSAVTDQALFVEVLGASANGRQDFLTEYIDEKLKCEEPAEIARGIMVVGFSDESEQATEVLSRYVDCGGLPGEAHKAARYAYERNQWARYWFSRMATSGDPELFWRCQIQFEKTVDGRFILWRSNYAAAEGVVQRFGPSAMHNLSNIYSNRKNDREKKLFGRDAPQSIFVKDALESI